MEKFGNLTVDILAKRIDDLMESGKSGIVVYCAADNYDDVANDHLSIAYLHELDTIYFNQPFVSYCGSKCRKVWKSYLNDFIRLSGGGECMVANPDKYLAEIYNNVIWHMTHDSLECPDLDNEDYDKQYKSYDPQFMGNWNVYDSFRLCGGETVGQDVIAFRDKLVAGEHFTITGKDGNVHEFSLEKDNKAKEYSDYDTIFSLVHYAEETYQDETYGPVPVIVSHRLLRATELNTLYAKSKTFIFLNFAE